MGTRRRNGRKGRDRASVTSAGNRQGRHWRALAWLLAWALVASGTGDALAARHKPASSAASPKAAAPATSQKPASAQRKKASAASHKKRKAQREKLDTNRPGHVIARAAAGDASAPLPPDVAAAKQAIDLARKGNTKDAAELAASLSDPLLASLVHWAMLRHPDRETGFDRYSVFIDAHPDWPSIPLLRRRAEARLWQDHRDADTVRRFVGAEPAGPVGRLALARIAMREGDRAAAESEVRAVWQSAALSAELETAVLAAFPDVLTRADHVARMDRRIGAKDFGAAMRAAKRVGDDRVAIVN